MIAGGRGLLSVLCQITLGTACVKAIKRIAFNQVQISPVMARMLSSDEANVCARLGYVDIAKHQKVFIITDRIIVAGNGIASVRPSVSPFVSTLSWKPTDC